MRKKALIPIFLITFALFLNISPVLATPVYEDFTTYTEEDPNNHITVAENHIDHYAVGNEDAYLYDDKGVDHFTDFEHLVDFYIDEVYQQWAYGWVWTLSNAVDDIKGLIDANEDLLMVEIGMWSTGVYQIFLYEFDAGTGYSHMGMLSLDVWFYLTLRKIGVDFCCEIYTDSARTVLNDNLTLTLQNDYTFRYIHGCNTFNDGRSVICDYDVENLALQEVAPPYITFYNMTGGEFWVDLDYDGSAELIANGTVQASSNDTVFKLIAVPYNISWLFTNFTWSGGSGDYNPHNFTVAGNNTIWCNFIDPILGGKIVGVPTSILFVGAMVVFGLFLFVFVISRRRR